MPSIAPNDIPVSLNSTGADVPMCAFATSRIYTSLTGTTRSCAEAVSLADYPRRRGQLGGHFANTSAPAAPIHGRLTAGAGRVDRRNAASPMRGWWLG